MTSPNLTSSSPLVCKASTISVFANPPRASTSEEYGKIISLSLSSTDTTPPTISIYGYASVSVSNIAFQSLAVEIERMLSLLLP